MIRWIAASLVLAMAFSLGGCPAAPSDADNANDNLNGGGGGNSNTNSSNGNANSSNDNQNSNNGNTNANDNANANANDNDNDNGDDGGELLLRMLSISESTSILTLHGSFGDAIGEVYVNGSPRSLAGGGWTADQIEVSIQPQDLGEVYVQVGSAATNSRWITGWDFDIRRTYQLFQQSLCPACQAQMTYRFRLRGDVSAVDDGSGNLINGGTANHGVRGATFSIDSVDGSWLSDFDGQQRVWSAEQTTPVYYIGGDAEQFVSGAGEWFSAFAGVDPGNSRAVVAVHVDTDGYRVRNLDTGESTVEHITDFGVYQNLSYPGTIVMPLSASLNVPAGSTQPDNNGSFWEWEAAPAQSPPPPGS